MSVNVTQQAAAINAAQQVADLVSRFNELLVQSQNLSKRITINGYLTTLAALPTAAWAADGAVGTADGTPSSTHPITSGGLYLASNDITGGVYMINDFISFMTNGTVTASDRLATITKLMR